MINEKKSKNRIIIWLLTGCFFIFAMVVIGGITRLTGSGLSITEWNVVMGAIPPLNESQWNQAFEKYKEIPQYKKLNSDYSISDFKKIFFWEYLHRLVGRLVGIVFLVPFIYFFLTRQLDPAIIPKLLLLFVLGGLQGFIGWFMVKSGLTDRTSVSHYRLAVHLVMAFITFAFTLWFALELIYQDTERSGLRTKKYYNLLKLLSLLVIIQIVYGAFTAGMHAGKFANTFPTMDGEWIPSGIASMNPPWQNFFENPVTIQFIHRIMAVLILVFSCSFWLTANKNEMSHSQRSGIHFLFFAVAFQFLLGVFTLISKVNITLASFHQVGAFALFSAVVFLLFQFKKNPALSGT